jgi:protein-S-isoprenylcysteine O-methyltransferase Ste14
MTRIPSLGSNGEGWVALQLVLLAAVALSGLFDTPRPEGELAQLLGLLGLAMMAGGALLLGRALVDLGRNLTPTPRPRSDARLVVGGIYAVVRHPMYGGLILTALGWAISTSSLRTLFLVVVLFAFFDLKARREEVWLNERYPGYAEYMARTRRFIPYVY